MEIDVNALKARAKVASLTAEPAKPSASSDELQLDYGFLTHEGLGALAGLASADPTADPVRSASGSRVRLLPTDPEWARKGFSLPLCEFLAYKSALAYGSETEIGINLNCCHGISRPRFFDTGDRDGIDTQGYGFIFEDAAFIVMRGSESATDWAGNQNDKITGDKPDTRWWPSAQNAEAVRVHVPGQHLGFARGWRAVRKQIEAWINDLPPTVDGKPRRFVFSGHSLGGALAQIGAFDFKTIENRDVVAVVTFGAPFVGNGQFSKKYEAVLGGRTVRLESDGDIVPQIMGRWYYRLHWRARDWIERRIYGRVSPSQSSLFQPAGQKWWFDKVPLLKKEDFTAVLQEFKSRMEREAQRRKEDAEQAEKDAKKLGSDNKKRTEDAESRPSGGEGPSGAGKHAGSTDTSLKPDGATGAGGRAPTVEGGAQSPPTHESGSGAGTAPGNSQLPQIVITIVGVVIGVVVIGAIGWGIYYFARSKFTRSHEIQKRYALYLSSLSYRRLRELHGGDVVKAHRDLDNHLLLVRGDLEAAEAASATLFTSLKNLPVRFDPNDDLATFQKEGKSYVC
jgi:hypothetical protein